MKKVYVSIVAIMFGIAGHLSAQSWVPATTTGTTFILYGMHFPPGQTDIGYACGMQYTYDADGVIVKTVDGGDNWTQIWPTSGSIDGLQGIWFINDTVGFACGWNNYFIKTEDGGTTWTSITVGSNVWYYKDVEFWDEDNGVACASMNSVSQSVFITDDGGDTWVPSTSGMATNATMGLCYAAEDTLYAVGTDAAVQWSTDGGHNWSQRATLPALLFGVDFANTSFGVVGAEEKMFATNDGGLTWDTYTTGYENFYGAKAYADGTAYIGGTDQNIYKTSDFGANWTMDNNGTVSSIYRIRENAAGSLFTSASQGSILIKAAPLSADFEADQTTVCVGSTVDFTDLSVGATSWSWVFEGGTPATSTDQNPTITYNTAGDFDVELTVSDGAGSMTETKTEYISVLDIPGQANTPTGDEEVCTSNYFDYTTVDIDYAEDYDWELSPTTAGTLTPSGNTATLLVADDFNGDFTIKTRATNRCGIGVWSSNFEGTAYTTPAEFELSNGGEYCDGEDGIEITLSGSELGVDYELFLDDESTGTIVSGTGSEISFGFQTDPGNYTVTGSSGSCSNYMGGTAIITISFPPDPALTPIGDTEVCAGTTTEYTVMPIEGADTIYWYLTPAEAGTIVGTGMDITIEWEVDFSGTAQLSAQGHSACGFGDESDPLEINCSAAPTPEISGAELVCKEEEADYETEYHDGSTYEWTVTGGTITMGDGTHQVTVLWGDPGFGTINLSETLGESCTGEAETLEVTIDDCIGIAENESGTTSIFPNPASGLVNIQSESQVKSIKFMDLSGKVFIQSNSTNPVQEFNVSDLKPGVYLIEIQKEESSEYKRILIK